MDVKVKLMRLVLFEPDIPQNAGSLLRLGACLGVGVDIVEPCGFVFGETQMRRAGMDYLDRADYRLHPSWEAFLAQHEGRIVLLTARASQAYMEFAFAPGDAILLGRESAGVPEHVHARADARLRIPMKSGLRSINVAQAGAMVLGEALRQTGMFP
jgi:tRNA (cytidine/uridine-2'-O-)-methyltransferase